MYATKAIDAFFKSKEKIEAAFKEMNIAVDESGRFAPWFKPIQEITAYLPFQLFKYFPTQMILGKLPVEEVVRGYVMGIIWLILSWMLFRFAWRKGIKHYSAVGA